MQLDVRMPAPSAGASQSFSVAVRSRIASSGPLHRSLTRWWTTWLGGNPVFNRDLHATPPYGVVHSTFTIRLRRKPSWRSRKRQESRFAAELTSSRLYQGILPAFDFRIKVKILHFELASLSEPSTLFGKIKETAAWMAAASERRHSRHVFLSGLIDPRP